MPRIVENKFQNKKFPEKNGYEVEENCICPQDEQTSKFHEFSNLQHVVFLSKNYNIDFPRWVYYDDKKNIVN